MFISWSKQTNQTCRLFCRSAPNTLADNSNSLHFNDATPPPAGNKVAKPQINKWGWISKCKSIFYWLFCFSHGLNVLLLLKAMLFQDFSIFKVRSTFWSPSWDWLLCQPFLSQPLWLTLFFLFPSYSTCGWLSNTSERDSAAITAEKQQSLWQRFPRRGTGGPPPVQAGRSGLYFSRGQSKGFVLKQNKREYGGNFGILLFHVFIWGVDLSVNPMVLLHLFIVRKGL